MALTGEGELHGAPDGCRWSSAAVASAGPDAEAGMTADGVREVIVLTAPGLTVLVEGQLSGEEEDARTHLAPCADPASLQTHRTLGPSRQHRRMMKIR